jgi:pimeloyl-ACP methyl ester carboxylesterase
MPEVPGVRHDYYEVGDVVLHVAEAGQGPPLVLIHGFPQHWYVWRRFITRLATDHRVICPDLRGFGWSEAPTEGYAKETLAGDILSLLDELGVERFAVGGHDWGAWAGFMMAMLAPERVERLLALSIFHPFMKPTLRFAAGMWHVWHGVLLGSPLGPLAMRPGSPLRALIFRWLGARSWSPWEREIFLGQFDEPERASATARLYKAVRQQDMPRILGGRYRRMRLSTPTLLIIGDRDRAIQPVRRGDWEGYADQMSVEYIDSGHAVLEEQPELILERAVSFFASGQGTTARQEAAGAEQ